MGRLAQLFETTAEDWVYGWLADDQLPPGAKSGPIAPNSAYVSIFLKSARVVNVQKGFTTFYGAVHSHIRIPSRTQDTAEFNIVTTPTYLKNVDAKGIDRVIQLNQRLLGPVPYVGGDLEIEVGLFSVAASNLAEPYLGLLESLSKQAGVSFITSALPFAGPILEGVKLLTNSKGDSGLEIGLSLTESEPRQGYCVAMRAPKDEVKLWDLKLDTSDFRLLNSIGRPFKDYPYMVLQIVADDQRADWNKIPEIRQSFAHIQELYRNGEEKETQAALKMFRRIALTCNDLIMEDARNLANRVEALYQIVAQPEPSRGAVLTAEESSAPEFPDLEAVNLYGK
jgi:hypothetical protein